METIKIGKEETPAILCDNFFPEINKFLENTYKYVEFEKKPTTYYPGLRAPLPRNYTITVLNKIYQKITEVFQVHNQKKLNLQSAFYSYVSKPENELNILQRIPHCDNMQPFSFAIMHYLNPGHFGGTGFFRHIPTGFERITMDRKDDYSLSLRNYLDNHGDPKQTYINKSDDHFELIANIDYKPNRLIVYPANILHSGLINATSDIHTEAHVARLTANIFIDFL